MGSDRAVATMALDTAVIQGALDVFNVARELDASVAESGDTGEYDTALMRASAQLFQAVVRTVPSSDEVPRFMKSQLGIQVLGALHGVQNMSQDLCPHVNMANMICLNRPSAAATRAARACASHSKTTLLAAAFTVGIQRLAGETEVETDFRDRCSVCSQPQGDDEVVVFCFVCGAIAHEDCLDVVKTAQLEGSHTVVCVACVAHEPFLAAVVVSCLGDKSFVFSSAPHSLAPSMSPDKAAALQVFVAERMAFTEGARSAVGNSYFICLDKVSTMALSPNSVRSGAHDRRSPAGSRLSGRSSLVEEGEDNNIITPAPRPMAARPIRHSASLAPGALDTVTRSSFTSQMAELACQNATVVELLTVLVGKMDNARPPLRQDVEPPPVVQSARECRQAEVAQLKLQLSQLELDSAKETAVLEVPAQLGGTLLAPTRLTAFANGSAGFAVQSRASAVSTHMSVPFSDLLKTTTFVTSLLAAGEARHMTGMTDSPAEFKTSNLMSFNQNRSDLVTSGRTCFPGADNSVGSVLELDSSGTMQARPKVKGLPLEHVMMGHMEWRTDFLWSCYESGLGPFQLGHVDYEANQEAFKLVIGRYAVVFAFIRLLSVTHQLDWPVVYRYIALLVDSFTVHRMVLGSLDKEILAVGKLSGHGQAQAAALYANQNTNHMWVQEAVDSARTAAVKTGGGGFTGKAPYRKFCVLCLSLEHTMDEHTGDITQPCSHPIGDNQVCGNKHRRTGVGSTKCRVLKWQKGHSGA